MSQVAAVVAKVWARGLLGLFHRGMCSPECHFTRLFVWVFFGLVTLRANFYKLQWRQDASEKKKHTSLHRIARFHNMIDSQMGDWVWGELMGDEVK